MPTGHGHDRAAAIGGVPGGGYSCAMSSCVERMEKECLALKAVMTARAVGRVYAAALRPLGLQPTQMHLLGALSLHPGAGMAELSEILVLERSTLVRNRSEEHTSELQYLMRISYAVFCL